MATTFMDMQGRRMGGNEIAFTPALKWQTRKCRAWLSQYGLEVCMSRRDWLKLQRLEAQVAAHVEALGLEGASLHSYVRFEEGETEEDCSALVRLKVVARTEVFDREGRYQEGMPAPGTPMDVRAIIEANKVWLREGRYGLELRVTQVKWYPREVAAAAGRTAARLQFEEDPEDCAP